MVKLPILTKLKSFFSERGDCVIAVEIKSTFLPEPVNKTILTLQPQRTLKALLEPIRFKTHTVVTPCVLRSFSFFSLNSH